MKPVSTREAARKMGVALITLQRHIAKGTITAPKLQTVGGVTVRLWTGKDIAQAREQLRKRVKP
jgi:hypothetical protein